MAQMKLQGKNSKKISTSKKKKMKETLKDMEESRKEDSIQLRRDIQQRIMELESDKEKANKIENDLREQLRLLTIKKYRIDGALIVLSEILKEKE